MGLGTPTADSVKFLSVILTVAVRNPHVIGKAVPGSSPNYMILALGGSLRILARTLLIIVAIIPIKNPFSNITRHPVHAFGSFARLQRTHFSKNITFIDKTTTIEVSVGFIGKIFTPGIRPMALSPRGSLPLRFSGEALATP
jgi:hypothetical protein